MRAHLLQRRLRRRSGQAATGARPGLRLLAAGLSPLLLAAKCNPTVEEAGAAVLLTAPVALGVTALVLWGLSVLFSPAMPALEVPWRPLRLMLVGWLGMALVGALPVALRTDVWTWVPMAHMTYGASVLVWCLLVWRIWVRIRPAGAFMGTLTYGYQLVTLPALLMVVAGRVPSFGDDPWTPVFVFWVYTGLVGIPAGVVLLVLVAEGVVRRRRATQLESQAQ